MGGRDFVRATKMGSSRAVHSPELSGTVRDSE